LKKEKKKEKKEKKDRKREKIEIEETERKRSELRNGTLSSTANLDIDEAVDNLNNIVGPIDAKIKLAKVVPTLISQLRERIRNDA